MPRFNTSIKISPSTSEPSVISKFSLWLVIDDAVFAGRILRWYIIDLYDRFNWTLLCFMHLNINKSCIKQSLDGYWHLQTKDYLFPFLGEPLKRPSITTKCNTRLTLPKANSPSPPNIRTPTKCPRANCTQICAKWTYSTSPKSSETSSTATEKIRSLLISGPH